MWGCALKCTSLFLYLPQQKKKGAGAMKIDGNPNPKRIYKHLNHIAIDCGCGMPGGRLAAICFETGKEFYSS